MDLLAQLGPAGRRVYDVTCRGGTLGEARDVRLIEAIEKCTKFWYGIRLRERLTVASGGEGKAIGNADILGPTGRMKLAERGILAADHGDIPKPDLFEPTNIWRTYHGMSLI